MRDLRDNISKSFLVSSGLVFLSYIIYYLFSFSLNRTAPIAEYIYIFAIFLITLFFIKSFINFNKFSVDSLFTTQYILSLSLIVGFLSILLTSIGLKSEIEISNKTILILSAIFLYLVYFKFKNSLISHFESKSYINAINSNVAKLVGKNGQIESVSSYQLVQDDIIQLEVGDVLSKDLALFKGEGIFKVYVHLAGFQTTYKKEGDFIPAGSILIQGKCLAQVVVNDSSAQIKDSQEYFLSHREVELEKVARQNKNLNIVILFIAASFLFSFVFLTDTLSDTLIYTLVLLSLTLLVDVLSVRFYIYLNKIEQLFFKGIYLNSKIGTSLNDLESLKIRENGTESSYLKSLVIYNEEIERDKASLLIFYLIGDIENRYMEIVKNAIGDQITYFSKNPLVSRAVVNNEGIKAEIEGIKILFGSEAFLISQGVILNTSEVFKTKASNSNFYLALGKEVYAGVEVEIEKSVENIEKAFLSIGKQVLRESNEEDAVSFSGADFGTKLSVISDSSYRPVNEDLNYIEVNIVDDSSSFSNLLSSGNRATVAYSNPRNTTVSLPFNTMLDFSRKNRVLLIASFLVLLIVLVSLLVAPIMALQTVAISSLLLTAYIKSYSL